MVRNNYYLSHHILQLYYFLLNFFTQLYKNLPPVPSKKNEGRWNISFCIYFSIFQHVFLILFFRNAHSLPFPLIDVWDSPLLPLFFSGLLLLPSLKARVKSASVYQLLNSAYYSSIRFYLFTRLNTMSVQIQLEKRPRINIDCKISFCCQHTENARLILSSQWMFVEWIECE